MFFQSSSSFNIHHLHLHLHLHKIKNTTNIRNERKGSETENNQLSFPEAVVMLSGVVVVGARSFNRDFFIWFL